MRKKLLDTFGAQVSSDHERYPADVKCLGFLYLYVGRYPRNNASRNSAPLSECCTFVSYDSLEELSGDRHLSHLSDTVLDEYAEEAE
ncbi:MAG: hypothetical protein BECKG1743F_GA0114225_109673 [Candidatus Kentron sp. G]|nr:MAG: hypothetical protein BECKG1743F_GA0114225_109673 [Candidatus Kentron sp. G]